MKRKEKRDLVLSMCLGDGCLAYTSNRVSASITIGHCLAQKDYLQLKADFLAKTFNQKVNVRQMNSSNAVQLSLCKKRFKAWRKFIYKDGKKDLSRILPFIVNPTRAVAFWLMDDGYVEQSISKMKDGSKKNYGARFRLFTCDQSLVTHEFIKEWFYRKFGYTIMVKSMLAKKKNKSYPFIKLNQQDTLDLWSKVRDFILITDSMKHKFRNVEDIYQKKLSQRTTE